MAGEDVVAAFSRFGFRLVRIHGSHHILRKDGHRYLLSVPVHGQEPVAKGTLRSLIRGAGITIEQFLDATC